MKAPLFLLVGLVLLAACCCHLQGATIETVSVGNPGNVGELSGSDVGIFGPEAIVGQVDHPYRIAKYEVTNAQYVEFLNGVDPAGQNLLALYNPKMAGNLGGIENTGTTDGARYVAQAGRAQNPVTYVSWYDAARFANWLHNGQGNADTENGAYTLLGNLPIPTNGLTVSRNANAEWFLPSENEWYKAAYHNPETGSYYKYPTSTDEEPYSDQPPGTDSPDPSNTINYAKDDGLANGFDDGLAVAGSPVYSSSDNPFTDVGAYTNATSPYGTFDQGGNVMEWNETIISGAGRGIRGGSWVDSHPSIFFGSRRFGEHLHVESYHIGFRVATAPTPEPSSLTLLIIALCSITVRRRRDVGTLRSGPTLSQRQKAFGSQARP